MAYQCLTRLGRRTIIETLTNIQHISSTARVQAKRRIAGWAVLRIKFLDVLVEACLMRDVTAGELEDALAAQGVFEWFFAHCTLAADKGPLPAVSTSVRIQHSCHTTLRGRPLA